MSEYHVPVMLAETLELLDIKRGNVFVDATLGGGGHSLAILERLSVCGGGSLYSIDQDAQARAEASAAVERSGLLGQGTGVKFSIWSGNFADMAELASSAGVSGADGILMDLGVSSHQLDDPARGFSFRADSPLDMRMNKEDGVLSAADLLAAASESELRSIIGSLGEEKFAGRIASAIVRERELRPIVTTGQLSELICGAVPKIPQRGRGGHQIHPATRTFQALRIAVNDELSVLRRGLESALGLLNPGGRIVVISYHSLEDRIVKTAFKSRLGRCVCPPLAPVCTCGAKASLKELTRHPLVPSDDELVSNPRSRSAKLRAAEKL